MKERAKRKDKSETQTPQREFIEGVLKTYQKKRESLIK